VNVSTRLIDPWLAYICGDYTFAHPEYWKRSGVVADIGMDRMNEWGAVTEAREIFWLDVADKVAGLAASVVYEDIARSQKIAEQERAAEKAGIISLF
jgi:hypothetical protein